MLSILHLELLFALARLVGPGLNSKVGSTIVLDSGILNPAGHLGSLSLRSRMQAILVHEGDIIQSLRRMGVSENERDRQSTGMNQETPNLVKQEAAFLR